METRWTFSNVACKFFSRSFERNAASSSVYASHLSAVRFLRLMVVWICTTSFASFGRTSQGDVCEKTSAETFTGRLRWFGILGRCGRFGIIWENEGFDDGFGGGVDDGEEPMLVVGVCNGSSPVLLMFGFSIWTCVSTLNGLFTGLNPVHLCPFFGFPHVRQWYVRIVAT